jgi:hypothetical protein
MFNRVQIFFGTPHRGSSAATMGKVMLNIAKVSGSRPDLLAALEKNQDGLQEITEDFTRVVAKYTIKSFYESDKMFGIKKVNTIHTYTRLVPGLINPQIVAKESATMNIPQEECIPIDGYHRDICRFSRDDDRFEAVWKAVKRMMVTQGTDISKKGTSPSACRQWKVRDIGSTLIWGL